MAVVNSTKPSQATEDAQILRIAGTLITVTSLVASLFIMFILPANAYAIGGLLVCSIGGILAGLGMLIAYKVMVNRARRSL